MLLVKTIIFLVVLQSLIYLIRCLLSLIDIEILLNLRSINYLLIWYFLKSYSRFLSYYFINYNLMKNVYFFPHYLRVFTKIFCCYLGWNSWLILSGWIQYSFTFQILLSAINCVCIPDGPFWTFNKNFFSNIGLKVFPGPFHKQKCKSFVIAILLT